MAKNERPEVADDILQILNLVQENRGRFKAEADERGITVNQLVAAAIAEMVAERLRAGHGPNK